MSANANTANTAKPAANVSVDADKVITEALKLADKTGQLTANLALCVIRDDKYTFSTLSSVINAKNYTKLADAGLCMFSPHYKAKLESLKTLSEKIAEAKARGHNDKQIAASNEKEDTDKAIRSVRLIYKTALKVALAFRGLEYVSAEVNKSNRLVFTDKNGAPSIKSAAAWATGPKTEREVMEQIAKQKQKELDKTAENKTADTAKQPPAIAQQVHATINALDLLMSAKTEDGKPAPIGNDIRNELDVLFAKLAIFYGKDGKPDWKSAERKVTAVLYKAQHPSMSAQAK